MDKHCLVLTNILYLPDELGIVTVEKCHGFCDDRPVEFVHVLCVCDDKTSFERFALCGDAFELVVIIARNGHSRISACSNNLCLTRALIPSDSTSDAYQEIAVSSGSVNGTVALRQHA